METSGRLQRMLPDKYSFIENLTKTRKAAHEVRISLWRSLFKISYDRSRKVLKGPTFKVLSRKSILVVESVLPSWKFGMLAISDSFSCPVIDTFGAKSLWERRSFKNMNFFPSLFGISGKNEGISKARG